MRIRLGWFVGVLAAALAVGGCNDHSLSLDLTPNPLVVGLLDKQVTVHARAVARGFGKVPMSSVQFAAFTAADSMIASQTEPINQSLPATPIGFVVDRDYTIPINGAAVALSGARYIIVKVLDPDGHEIARQRLDIVVHALKDMPIPSVIREATPTPHP
ncbi:MAG: hypothetical protein M3T49_09345 [Candidatus Eremiobacteraeota bacterium]|nr:hypothetical protein [Candidatus Eremiobacteraeota bacterium]